MKDSTPLILVLEAHTDTFFHRLEDALRPYGLRAVREARRPAAILLDARDGRFDRLRNYDPSPSRGHPPSIIALVPNSLAKRSEALRIGAQLAVSESDPSILASYLAQVVLSRELEAERVLVVDDSLVQCKVLRNRLRTLGWNVQMASSARECFEQLESFRPNLLVLDFEMPEVNGAELCSVLRADPRWRKLQIVFWTADRQNEAAALDAGGDDVLHKGQEWPYILKRLASRVNRTRPLRLEERDTLTGCLDRRHAAVPLDRLMRLARRKNRPFALAMLDIDHFKKLNDRYGHAAGDQVLARLGEILRHYFRREDIVARWGGEEFLIVMHESTAADAKVRFDTLLERVRGLRYPFADENFSMTFSAGISQMGLDGNDLGTLMAAADECLYRAKAEGRARTLLASQPPVSL